MKKLMVVLLVGILAAPVWAQFSPVQITVQRVSKKKDAGETATGIGGGWVMIRPGDYSASMALRITIRNTGQQPVNGAIVRWGIIKSQVVGFGRGGNAAYGAEETIDLKGLESKLIETPTITASGQQFGDGEARGEKIRGHGVQVLLAGKVVAEEFSPVTAKKSFENLRPVTSAEQTTEAAPAPAKSGKRKSQKD